MDLVGVGRGGHSSARYRDGEGLSLSDTLSTGLPSSQHSLQGTLPIFCPGAQRPGMSPHSTRRHGPPQASSAPRRLRLPARRGRSRAPPRLGHLLLKHEHLASPSLSPPRHWSLGGGGLVAHGEPLLSSWLPVEARSLPARFKLYIRFLSGTLSWQRDRVPTSGC